MASRAKAGDKPADNEAEAPASTEELSAKLQAMMDEAEPKDAEQPKAVARKTSGKKAEAETPAKEEKPEKPKLKENEISGEITDGGEVRIGLPRLVDQSDGKLVTKKLIVPKTWTIVKPNRGRMTHVVDTDHPETTLCTLKTDWVHGSTDLGPTGPVTCEWCARRLIALKKVTRSQLVARKKAAEAAALKAAADAKKAKEQAPAKKAEAEAKSGKSEAPQAKPDPKPSSRTKAA